ncbi:toprim domain-containing protein [Sphaerotilus sp.]|uniref:DUF7146 domain-containing protein n=1 Tax=Sphaerotilus sp. TaxID=2093942 RepID=UPI0034E197ED
MNAPSETFRLAVLAELGYAPDHIEPGKLHRFTTCTKASDRAGWCKLFADERGGVYGCNRSGMSGTWSAKDRASMTPAEHTAWRMQTEKARREREFIQRRQWAENGERNARLWAACRDLVPGDPVTLYIKRRLLAPLWPVPLALRFHPALPYRHEGDLFGCFPAMVAAITNPAGELVALHRTWLSRDGQKANVPGPGKKVTQASGPLIGGCVRLGAPMDGVIGVAEGVETALAVSMASVVPTVAAYSAGALAGWIWPADVRLLVIFADADKAGREAADRLRQRAQAAALRVSVLTPQEEGADWCDVWAARDLPTTARTFDRLHDLETANREGAGHDRND